LCHIIEELGRDPEFTEECEFGEILEWIYQICGVEATVSQYILQTLKLAEPPGCLGWGKDSIASKNLIVETSQDHDKNRITDLDKRRVVHTVSLQCENLDKDSYDRTIECHEKDRGELEGVPCHT
jgi:hypothetical protein